MKTITASKARANLYRLIEETADSSEPLQITGRKHQRGAGLGAGLAGHSGDDVPAFDPPP